MTKLIRPDSQGYQVLTLNEIRRTLAEEKGLKTPEEINAYLDSRKKNWFVEKKEEIKGAINKSRWGPREDLISELEKFPNFLRMEQAESYIKGLERDLSKVLSQYTLARTGEMIPVENLRLICIEPLSPRDIELTKEGLGDSGLRETVNEALHLAEHRGFPYVALSENASSFSINRLVQDLDEHNIVLANLYVDVSGGQR